MKKYIVILFIISVVSYGQVFKPFTKLYTIETEKFEIIFPIESRRSAEELYKIADDIYDKYSKILNSKVYGKIPVVITPDINIFNSMAMNIPYASIVLYDTPSDGNWTTFKNNFESVFIHELTHLLTLASENSGFQTRIFGTWASLVHINAMAFMVEGAPVSMESLNGFGRANDPLVKERLRQDIREGKFKTPIQASGVWDKIPYGSVYYEYGGLFSKYIQDRFGMEKYNLFWMQMQTKLYISFRIYNSGLYKAFEEIYGIKFIEVWSDFQSSLTLTDIESSEELKITKNETIIEDIVSYENKVYYIDKNDSTIKEYDTKEKRYPRKVIDIDYSCESIDISKDGKKVLLVSTVYNGGLYKYIVKEYDIEKKKKTKRKWENISYARYFRDGIIGISKNLHNSTLVYINEEKNIELILPPNNYISYSSPSVIDEDNIALIVTEEGIKSIRILNYKDKTLKNIEIENENVLKYVRYLRYSSGKLIFSYDDNDRFYKPGYIYNSKAYLYKKDFSGGVFNAVIVKDDENNETIYYKGRFSEYDALMRYPKDENLEVISIKDSKSIYISDIENAALSFTPSIELKKYNGIKYFKPWAMWVPLPQINQTYQYFFNGIGILSVASSPSSDYLATIWLGYDIPSNFLQAEINLTTYGLLYPLNIFMKNMVIYSKTRYWRTSASISMNFNFDISNDKTIFSISPFFSGAIYSKNATDYKSAFTWAYGSYSLNAGLTISLMHRVPSMKPYREDLVKVVLYPAYSINATAFITDIKAVLQTRYLPLRLLLYGSWAYNGNVEFDGESRYFGNRPVRGQVEFFDYVYSKGYKSNYLVGGELELIGYLDAEFNLSHIYFNNFFASLSYKASYYDVEYMHSISIKIGTKASIPIVGYANILSGEPYISVAFRLPNSNTDFKKYPSIKDLYIGFGYSTSW